MNGMKENNEISFTSKLILKLRNKSAFAKMKLCDDRNE